MISESTLVATTTSTSSQPHYHNQDFNNHSVSDAILDHPPFNHYLSYPEQLPHYAWFRRQLQPLLQGKVWPHMRRDCFEQWHRRCTTEVLGYWNQRGLLEPLARLLRLHSGPWCHAAVDDHFHGGDAKQLSYSARRRVKLQQVVFQLNYLYLCFVIHNSAEHEAEVISYSAFLHQIESAWQAIRYELESLAVSAGAGGVYLIFGL